jgi:hypothetical protein
VITEISSGVLHFEVDLPTGAFVSGTPVQAVLRGVAGRDVTLTGGEVDLVKTVSYHHRQWNPYGGSYSAPIRRVDVISRQLLRAGVRYSTGESLVEPVTLAIPADEPGSVTSDLIGIEWSVQARLHTERARDVEATRTVVVLSRATERGPMQDSPPVSEDRNCARLALQDLSSRRLLPGVPLFGVLTIEPRRRLTLRSIRLELLLRQQVHHGPWIGTDPARNPSDQSLEADTVVASVIVGEDLNLDPGPPRRFPFTVPVPPQLAAPSLETSEFTVTWILRGVLDRVGHQDPWIEMELRGSTTTDRGHGRAG